MPGPYPRHVGRHGMACYRAAGPLAAWPASVASRPSLPPPPAPRLAPSYKWLAQSPRLLTRSTVHTQSSRLASSSAPLSAPNPNPNLYSPVPHSLAAAQPSPARPVASSAAGSAVRSQP